MARSKSPETIGQRRLVSTRGLFIDPRSQSKALPGRPILKPKGRRRGSMSFHPPPKVSKASPLERFGKRHLDRAQRPSKRGHPFLRNLSGVLDKSRKRILRSVSNSLEATMGSLNNRLIKVQLEAEKSLKHSEYLHTTVAKPFAEERLQLTTTNADGTQVIDQVPLMKRLQEHRQIMMAEAKEIEILWDRWIKVRQETTCLALEVLGDQAFELAYWADDTEFQKHLADSVETFHSEQTVINENELKKQQFEQGAKEVTDHSVKAMLKTQEEWKRDHGDLKRSLDAKADRLREQMKSMLLATKNNLNSLA